MGSRENDREKKIRGGIFDREKKIRGGGFDREKKIRGGVKKNPR